MDCEYFWILFRVNEVVSFNIVFCLYLFHSLAASGGLGCHVPLHTLVLALIAELLPSSTVLPTYHSAHDEGCL